MVRALKKLGFVNERQVGSHVRMVKGTWRATVPMHTPLRQPARSMSTRQPPMNSMRFRMLAEPWLKPSLLTDPIPLTKIYWQSLE